ncbi:MAG TPA: hypothetical protein PLB36_06440 [Bacillota bacterium]|nr:hypothetical protein [Candidatus Fermentithermobacillaceae bacterium]HOB30774.1 hypothetical protein [Bacillota bacterium]HOK64937.1 hypothetical protein [Bacillota bacterium]HOL12504.1 hypothetical protein [Bacillota bacterium]HOQ03284.1 hypothetical protein [Bacillota bacterium]
MQEATRFIDSGWRITIPKDMRELLGWTQDTLLCVHWDGFEISVKAQRPGCGDCPDVSRMGALGKIVIPHRVREEAMLYPGQILTLTLRGDQIIMSTGNEQVRCAACGSEADVLEVLPNVHLCKTCRAKVEAAAAKGLGS